MKFHSFDANTERYTATFTGEELHKILAMIKAAYDHYDDLDGTAMGIYGKEMALPFIKKAERLVGDKKADDKKYSFLLGFELVGDFMTIFHGYSFESNDHCQSMGFDKEEAEMFYDTFFKAHGELAFHVLKEKRDALKEEKKGKPQIKFHSYDTETGHYTVTFSGAALHNLLVMVKAAYDHYEDLDGTAMGIYGKETALPIIQKVQDLVEDKKEDDTSYKMKLDFDLVGEISSILDGYSFESEEHCKSMGFDKEESKTYYKIFVNASQNIAGPLLDKKREALKKNKINKSGLSEGPK